MSLPPLSKEMEDKLEQWVAAKRQRDFETSDRIRAEMKDAGVNPEEYRPPPGKGGGGYGGGAGDEHFIACRGGACPRHLHRMSSRRVWRRRV